MRKTLAVLAGVASLAFAGAASAATYVLSDDHCTGTCGQTTYGTIDVTGDTITVNLTGGATFHANSGSGLDNLDFSLTPANPNPTLTFVGLPSGWSPSTEAAGTNHEDGFGNWDYVLDLAKGNNGITSLSFTVNGSGVSDLNTLLQPNFVDNKNIYFVVDVIGANGLTGPIGAVKTSGGVPEPASWALMILGVFGMGAVLRRQRSAKAVLA